MNFSDFGHMMNGFEGGVGSDFDLDAATPMDLDNDGTFESMVQGVDTNRDGKIDSWTIVTDLDRDGTFERTFEGVDIDRDGKIDSWTIGMDLDNDGTIDRTDVVAAIDNDGAVVSNFAPYTPMPASLDRSITPQGSIATDNSQLQSWEHWSSRIEDSKSIL